MVFTMCKVLAYIDFVLCMLKCQEYLGSEGTI